MKKLDLKVPAGIKFLSEWNNFESNIPAHCKKVILNKGLCGCGCTEYFLRNDKPTILVSPRRELINSKIIVPRKNPLFYFDRSNHKKVPINDSINSLLDYIKQKESTYKILVTYDSFSLIVQILEKYNCLNDFVIIVDEFTSIFTDAKLKGSTELKFIRTLNKLNNYIMYISATPLQEIYLDEIDEFKDMLYVSLLWDESLYEKINITKYKMDNERESIKRIIDKFNQDHFFQKKEINGQQIYSTEAVFFLNSVKDIIAIIQQCKLTTNNTRVICSNNKTNEKNLRTVGFKIDHVPGINEYKIRNKTFTFVTKASFEGTDFYSDVSTTYIFANPNKENLALDISIDISQIVGRCRTKENPFRKDIMFFYKTSENKESDINSYIEQIKRKIKTTETSLENLKGIHDENIISKLKTAQELDKYKNDYIDIIENGTNSEPIFNKLAMIADVRAIEIKSLQYKNIFTVSENLNTQEYNVTDYCPLIDEKLHGFYNSFMNDCNFSRRAQLYCETLETKPEYNEAIKTIKEIPNIIKIAYDAIGPQRMKALGYKESNIRQELQRIQSNEMIASLLRQEIKYYTFYSNKELKKIIATTYKQVGLNCCAKANDIKKYLPHYQKIKKQINNKRVLGYTFNFEISVYNNICTTKEGKTYDAIKILQAIKNGGKDESIKKLTNLIRENNQNKEYRNKLKKDLPVIMWQGIFSSRNNAGVQSLSSLVCIDIDQKGKDEITDLRNKLTKDPFVFAVFTSPSGDGLKIIIKTDNYEILYYKNIYKQIENYFYTKYNIEVDKNCEAISQGCYASYDPNIHINLLAESIHFEFDQSLETKAVPSHITNQEKLLATSNEFIIKNRSKAIYELNDDNIIYILDKRFKKFPQNYQDGNRTNAIFAQASELCKAGVSFENAISYLETTFLPTGYIKSKLIHEATNGYKKNEEDFGINREKFLSYNEYKEKQLLSKQKNNP